MTPTTQQPTAAPADAASWVLLTFDEEEDPDTTTKPVTREEGLEALLLFPSGGTGETCFDEWRLRQHASGVLSVEHDRGCRGQLWFACLAHTEQEAREHLATYLA